ncbi:hypothetical protein WICPIJ_004774 [Wickerhamomyces pijperi]|uniref:Genetic interactor of prohibitin 7, mitochondrial n=1 Tax=Wickerhamomyces pijperi TaxID=599730 RepID=A0A9P8Q7H1_WICPI|nr:hypothetical protein WICPIJ_004774 [Wickerhamomyces pijperi]
MSLLRTSIRACTGSLPSRAVLSPRSNAVASYSMKFPTLDTEPIKETKATETKKSTTEPTTSTSTSTSSDPSQVKQVKLSAKERAKFSSMSIRDIFDGFLTTEESYDPIDTKPIFEDPSKFPALSTFHRDQVIQEVEKRMKRNWGLMTDDQKRMAYYISYANWGPRETLSEGSTKYGNVPPEDLPFALPSKLAMVNPTALTKIHKLPDVDLLQISEGRKEEFKNMTRKFDPLSKAVIYFALIISCLALWRDKLYGEEDMERLKHELPESPLVLAELKRQQEYEDEQRLIKEKQEQEERERLTLEEEQSKRSSAKKWYYLWLR